jgi:hypothetical protein
MIRWRLIIPAVLVAAALAGSFIYFVTLPPPQVEALAPPAPAASDVSNSIADAPTIVGPRRTAEDFERAAREILKQLPNAQASARTDELPIIGHVPLPKRRPIPR